MLPNLPFYIAAVFILTTAATVWLLARAANNNRTTLIIISLWAVCQAILSLSGFYKNTEGFPPRLALLGLPPLLFIIGLLTTERGKEFIQQIDLQRLTALSVVRIPVEIVLLWLFQNGVIPQIMTFEGRNFDILMGLTAPIVAVMAFQNGRLPRRSLLIGWHLVAILFLLNIVVIAVLSAPTVLQRFAFDQPNVAILYFPFVWLPSVVVPIVLFSHLASLKKLFSIQNTEGYVSA